MHKSKVKMKPFETTITLIGSFLAMVFFLYLASNNTWLGNHSWIGPAIIIPTMVYLLAFKCGYTTDGTSLKQAMREDWKKHDKPMLQFIALILVGYFGVAGGLMYWGYLVGSGFLQFLGLMWLAGWFLVLFA